MSSSTKINSSTNLFLPIKGNEYENRTNLITINFMRSQKNTTNTLPKNITNVMKYTSYPMFYETNNQRNIIVITDEFRIKNKNNIFIMLQTKAKLNNITLINNKTFLNETISYTYMKNFSKEIEEAYERKLCFFYLIKDIFIYYRYLISIIPLLIIFKFMHIIFLFMKCSKIYIVNSKNMNIYN